MRNRQYKCKCGRPVRPEDIDIDWRYSLQQLAALLIAFFLVFSIYQYWF